MPYSIVEVSSFFAKKRHNILLSCPRFAFASWNSLSGSCKLAWAGRLSFGIRLDLLPSGWFGVSDRILSTLADVVCILSIYTLLTFSRPHFISVNMSAQSLDRAGIAKLKDCLWERQHVNVSRWLWSENEVVWIDSISACNKTDPEKDSEKGWWRLLLSHQQLYLPRPPLSPPPHHHWSLFFEPFASLHLQLRLIQSSRFLAKSSQNRLENCFILAWLKTMMARTWFKISR